MSFNWKDYLSLAKELLVMDNEAKLRSSISRAYYSVFCKARNYLEDIGKIQRSRSGIVHKLVIEVLRSLNDKTSYQIAINLDRLRVDRNKSDYDDVFPNIIYQAEMDIELAQETFELIESLET